MPEERKKPSPALSSKWPGPLTANGMLHIIENPGTFDITRTTIEELLQPIGLDWGDVEDVFPAYITAKSFSRTGTPRVGLIDTLPIQMQVKRYVPS